MSRSSISALPGRLAERHSLRVEAVLVVMLYVVSEATRGLVAGSADAAMQHARTVVSIERSLHLFVESHVQSGVGAIPGLLGVLGILYLSLHLVATGGYLLWLHRRRPDAFPVVRTTLMVASAVALVGYLVFPTAPPRLADLGIADTISSGHVNLNKGLVSALYNPFAAVPSMHIGFAVVVGASLVRDGGRRALRALGMLYPLLVLLIIVATGNHFFFDAAAGALVAAFAIVAARSLTSARVHEPATDRRVRITAPANA
jgi:hypothetical protein